MEKIRKLVFISHANPEDNEFTLWLCTRLHMLGYSVWSDITQLFGAEIFWDDIEDCIRNHAAKFVIVLSANSQQKQGVLDEVNLAVTIERNKPIKDFVIPVRIDDFSYDNVRINIGRKNIIDFYESWPKGFGQLIKVLERGNVVKEQTLSSQETSACVENILAGSQRLVKKPQSLMTNRFQFKSMPKISNSSWFHCQVIRSMKNSNHLNSPHIPTRNI